ncbi:acyltransferase family protein [Cellulomonas sp. PhB150]|uniref:acyltransferase family protein n=1 Tax=Cellulomonas sp. PhB150 TaxID=2485188 RepID=UPI000F4A0368|nr:acyltransferase family protein [Cellulomonas sp. PhB150]ROS22975.1 peptidoglycan/LPS O-acetylase OafA/YrhL [Cellulomonas sp. PhB150]
MSHAAAPEVATRRKDITGLRAIAVLLVVVDHAFGRPTGGYLGVDIFFLLSGFLITGIMLREHATTGRISFGDFYRRRARRILPAAVLVIAATVAVAQVLFLANRARQVEIDGFWSLVFLANWHFAAEGTDYFAAGGPVSPFQHYWSLGVEEQFYVVWPLLVVGCLLLAARLHRRRGLVLGAVAVLVTAGSFAWALDRTAAEPSVAYFSTFTRGWELALGALIAVVAGGVGRLPDGWWRAALAVVGLVALVGGAFWLTPRSAVPGPWSALPVLGAAAVVVAGIGVRPPRLGGLLSNPVAQYVGLISFSLYLWHWPVIVYLESVMAPGSVRALTAVLISLALSVLSFHLVEDPARRSSWLEPRRRRRERSGREPFLGPTAARACLGALVGLAMLTAGFAVTHTPTAVALPPSAVGDPEPSPGATRSTAEAELATAVTAALKATTWPDLTPKVDSLGPDSLAAPWATDDCLDVTTTVDADRCQYGDLTGKRTAVVIGDSVATSYVPGIADALKPAGWLVQPLTLQACPAAAVAINDFSGARWKPCDPHHARVLDEVERIKPDLVIVASAEDSIARLTSDATGTKALDEWQTGMTTTLKALTAASDDVVVLGAPPAGLDLRTCATARSTPASCVSQIHDTWWNIKEADEAAVKEAGGGARYVDVHSWFCSSSGYCPAFEGSTPVRADPNHLTDAFSHQLADVLRESLTPDAA